MTAGIVFFMWLAFCVGFVVGIWVADASRDHSGTGHW